jgi:hypothetical protein
MNLTNIIEIWCAPSVLLSAITQTEDWFACRDFFSRAVDVGVFAEVAPVSLSDDKVVAREL